MTHINRSIVATVMNLLPNIFDAHMLEKRVLRLYAVAVAKEILEFNHTSDALHQFSASFARWVDREFQGQIRQTQKVVSENLGGEPSQNQAWEKIVNQITEQADGPTSCAPPSDRHIGGNSLPRQARRQEFRLAEDGVDTPLSERGWAAL